MTSNAELGRMLSAASEDLDRIGTVLVQRLAAMSDAMNGWPRSAWAGEGGGRANVSFCEEHEQERCGCGGGTTYAANSDRTGETALLKDRAANHRRELERALSSIQRQARAAFDIVQQYGSRPPTPAERAETLVKMNDRDISCWSCARTKNAQGMPRWEPARCAVEVDGHRRELCRWCQDWVRETGRLPLPAELERHHSGKPVRRPA